MLQKTEVSKHPLFSLENIYQAYRNCRFHNASRQDFECLPEHKTLFKARPGCGLPIGNLTSQFFANVYLDALDQFVKHQLKARFYLRYCDDLVLLSENREELADWERRIEAFLSAHLSLRLNERRKLRPVSDGIDFLGYIVRPDYLLVRGRVVDALRLRLRQTEDDLIQLGMKNFPAGRMVYPWPWILLKRMRQCLNSYLAHFEKASCYHLIRKIRERFFWLEEYFQWQKGKVVYRCPIPRRAMRFVNQKSWFKRHLPGHVLLIRQGGFWEFDVASAALGEVTKNEVLAAVKSWPRRFPDCRLRHLKPLLWDSGLLVGWVGETGRRLSNIAERTLICRWASIN